MVAPFPFISGKPEINTYVSVSIANFKLSKFMCQSKRSFIIDLKIIRLNKGEQLIRPFPSPLFKLSCLASGTLFLTLEIKKLCILQMTTRKSLGTPLSLSHSNQKKTLCTVVFVIKTVAISIFI